MHINYTLIFILLYIGGCSATHQMTLPIEMEDIIVDDTSDTYKHEISWWSEDKKRPKLGIALSGGGSKSAPFVMGVLKRFVDEGWIDKVDIISSVSGGGYSAYYLFSKAIYLDKNKHENLKIEAFFESYELEDEELNSVKNNSEYEYSLKKYREIYESVNLGKYQAHVKKYQDILSWGSSELHRGGFVEDDFRSAYTALECLFGSLIASPFHHVANSLFDWKLEMVPSQYKYKRGIIRGYGENEYVNGNLGEETFEDLRAITNDNTVPLWIINSSNFGKDWWKNAALEDDPDLLESIFEITPYGYGSDRYPYRYESPTNISLDLPRAVLASAAFFDAMGDRKAQGATFLTLHILNSRWGVKIPNYNSPNTQPVLDNLIPFPFYYLDSERPKITIADGGQSGDNLGVYSLIKRGTENIVIVSAADDGIDKGNKLKMEDICQVSKFLVEKGFEIYFEGTPEDKDDKTPINFYGEFCTDERDTSFEYVSYYNWKKPVWRGVLEDKNGNKTNLYFIKAAIDKNNLTQNANAFKPNKCKIWNCPEEECTQDVGEKHCARTDKNNPYPSSLLHFWLLGDRDKDTANFPQTSTVGTTLNSSQNLYQAYLDLGFWASQFLAHQQEFMRIVKSK